ncbi:PEP-CTERM sorting domain-containing protein [Nostoc sp. TCL26-01]|uniref:PEP-CTERM sorting domain-containing protein n=1 Tax=Nostoc sp. TCL26-01 TaxID=2576904 RepID=UPI0015BA4B4D|nr:PEP-CTERM sorting domain-containing protein [Nostoc sp. TCL26-01]QLE58191.1 PEP-CTERM sorting domain-containing protein [Nostoc sp. TCL26-01]
MKKTSQKLLILSAIILTPLNIGLSQAPAAAITLNLSNVNFVDGGKATGSFEYDVATNTISNWNIQTTIGSVLTTAFNYTSATSTALAAPTLLSSMNDKVFVFTKNPLIPNPRSLAIILSNPVNNTPGSFSIASVGEGNISTTNITKLFSGQAITFSGAGGGRLGQTGGSVVNPVPEPEDILGIGVALGFLGLFAKTYYKKSKLASFSK